MLPGFWADGIIRSRGVHDHASRPQGWLLLESSATSYGQTTPYLPVIDLLKAYFQLEDRDDGRRRREKLTGRLLMLDPALGPTLPAFLALLEVPGEDAPWQSLDPSQRRQRTLDALQRLLLRESQVQPLLLVVENLHWIDTETQAFLDGLVENLHAARILLLVNYRPEYEPGWRNKISYTQLRLDPLPPASIEAMLRSLLGDDAGLEPLKRCLSERSQGNPFFLEESVRTLVETQVLVGDQGAYRLTRALPSIQVPATVQAVLAARIDRLPPEEKALLQTAAVIGTEVPLALLQAVAEAPEEPLRLGLTHLQAGEFLYETRLFPEIAYTFKHALTQQVAYETLLQERRRALHARIVAALEARTGNGVAEQVERLAHHAVRGAVWDKALRYCRQAGERAMARSAHREAVGHFDHALSVLTSLPAQRDTHEQAIELRLALRSALMPSSDSARILTCLHEAEALAGVLDDHHRLGQISGFLSVHFRNRGAYDQAIIAAQRTLALATADGDGVLHALANLYLGAAYWAQGAYARAIDCCRETVASLHGPQRLERFGQVTLPAVQAGAFLAVCYAELGRFAAGKAFGDDGVQIAEAVTHPSSLMWACYGSGLLGLRQGDLPRALPLLERAIGICQEADLPLFVPRMAAALGTAYTLAGRGVDAVALLTPAVEQTMETDMAGFQALCRLSLGEAQVLAGRLEEALALAERALAHAHAHQERGNEAYALRLLGEIAARREPRESDQAEGYYRQALALAEERGMRPLQAHCHRGLGMLYAMTGQREQACTELSTAIELYQAMEMTFWLPETEAAVAQVEER
jgi:tetratricopeptide (TPR) repeat protein